MFDAFTKVAQADARGQFISAGEIDAWPQWWLIATSALMLSIAFPAMLPALLQQQLPAVRSAACADRPRRQRLPPHGCLPA